MSQNRLARAATALPFLAFTVWTSYILHRNGINECVNGFMNEIVATKKIHIGSVNIPILKKFFHVEAIDEALKPVTVAFAPSTLGIDPVSWYQGFTFLTDYGVLYAVWLFESTRKANSGTPANYPFLFFMPAQIVTIGVMGPLYYFLSYTFTPLSTLLIPGNRTTNTAYTRGIFLTLTTFFFIPLFGTYLHPSLSARHAWNFAWQLFPIFVSLTLSLIAFLPSSTSNSTAKKTSASSNSDLTVIRYTIIPLTIVSASVYLYTIYTSPFSLATLFVPYTPTSNTFLPVMRRFFQVDQISSFEASLLWLTYIFTELKAEGLVKQSWLVLLVVKATLFACLGPGATFAIGWLWREEVLAAATSDVSGKKRK